MDKNWLTAYYKDPVTGSVSEVGMYAIDARDAVKRYPDQYRLSPWSEKPAEPAAPKQPDNPPRRNG